MRSDVFDQIKQLVREANFPRVIHPEQEPDHLYLLAQEDGRVEKLTACPPPFQGQALSLDCIVSWLGREGSDSSQVWYNPSRILAVSQKRERRDWLKMPLDETPQLKTIRVLGQKEFDQKQFIRLAKIDLHKEVPDFFLQSIRGLIFKKNAEAAQRVDTQKASLGRRIQAELELEEGSLPDFINLRVQVFTLLPYTQDVRCSLDVNLEAEKFSLTPLPMEIDNAIMRTLNQVRDCLAGQLVEQSIPVYYGGELL